MESDRTQQQELVELVDLTAHQLQRHALISGTAAVEIGCVGFLIAAVCVDMVYPLPVPLRVAAWTMLWIVLLGTLGYGVIRPTIKRPKPIDVALRIEHTIGGMHNRLLTVLDLESRNGDAKADPDFVHRLLEQTKAKLAAYQIEHVADPKLMRRAVMGVGATLVIAILLAIACSDRLPTALERILFPTSNIPPATWLRIKSPGDLNVLRGDALDVIASFSRGDAPSMELHLRDPGGEWVTYPMASIEGGGFHFKLKNVVSDYEYYLSAGRTWTERSQIHVVPRPVIKKVQTSIEMPAYMKIAKFRPVPADATKIEAPIGATIHVDADVSGEVQRGELTSFEPQSVKSHKVIDDETVWFEDDLPADATTTGRWRWSTSRTYSGVKAFTFGWQREPFAFTTRLYPMTVSDGGYLFFYLYLDPQQTPDRLIVKWTTDKGHDHSVVWGKPLVKTSGGKKLHHMGELPEAGKWQRLEVPLKTITGRDGAFKFVGMGFEIDGGRATFDRPGWLRRHEEDVENTKLIPTRSSSMDHADGTERWSDQLPVEKDVSFAVRFYNGLGHASVQQRPVQVIAVKDQPPTVMIERPARDVMLAEPAPLPIITQAFDDYGIARLGIQIGPDKNNFQTVRWFQQFESPSTSMKTTTSIDPTAEQMHPGSSIYYRVVVQDFKGQEGYSEAYRLSIAAPEQQHSADAAQKPKPLDDLLKGLGKLLSAPLELTKGLGDLLKSLPPEMRSEQARRTMTNPDGTPMTDEQIRKMFEQAAKNLSEEQQKQLAEVNRQLDQQSNDLENLSKNLADAAKQSEQSPLSAPLEADALKHMSNQAAQMSQQLNPKTVSQGQAGQLERAARAQPLTNQQQANEQAMQQQLHQIQSARSDLASNPQQAQQTMQRTMAQMRAADAANDLQRLRAELEARKQAIAQLQQNQSQLQQQTPSAQGQQLSNVSKNQNQLDQKIDQQVSSNRQLLQQKPRSADDLPQAPWVPPGQMNKTTPVEHDTPSQKKPDANAQANANKGDQDQADQKDQDFWDKPVNAPATAQQNTPDQRYADRNRPVDQPTPQPGQKAAGQTPRQMLQQHQDAQQQVLTENSDELAKALGETGDAQQQLGQALGQQAGQPGEQGSEAGQAQQGQAAQGQQANAGQPQGQAGQQSAAGQQASGQQASAGQQGQSSQGQPAGGNQPGGQAQANAGQQGQAGQNQSGQAGQQGQANAGGQQPGGAQANAGGQQGQAAQGNPGATDQQLQDLLNSPEMQKLLAMARQLQEGGAQQMANAQGQSNQGGQGHGQTGQSHSMHSMGGGMSGSQTPIPGTIAGLPADPAERAALMRLPPRVREPLLQGMQEHGPDGYQPLIDEYYRQLTRDADKDSQ